MSDPLDYFNKVNYNIRGFETTNQIVEYLPPIGIEKKIRFCRCWQSKKFPYCDDTHKVMNEAGDSVGPFVAIIKNEEPTTFHKLKLTNKIGNTNTPNFNINNKMTFKNAKVALAAVTALATSFYVYKLSSSIIKYKKQHTDKLSLTNQ